MTEETSAPEVAAPEADPAMSNPMLGVNNQPDAPKWDPSEPPRVELPGAAKEEPKEAPRIEGKPDTAKFVQDALGDLSADPQLKPISAYLTAKLGDKVDLARAFGHAVERGDSDLIDRAYLAEILGGDADEVATLAASLFEAAAAKASSVVTSIYNEFGGEASVRQAVGFYNTKADPEERAAMALLLDSGNKASINYAMKKITEFAAQAGGVRVQTGGGIPLGQPSAQRGLSSAEYQKQVGEAHRRGARPAEFDRLRDLRKLGLTQGL